MTRSIPESESERNLYQISVMYLRGMKQYEMAEELKISPATISGAISLLKLEWREKRVENINEMKMKELDRVDLLEREYWVAWELSKKDKVKTVKREGSVGLNGIDETIESKEGQVGDPRFLQGVQWCVDKRCEILGIDNSSKNESLSVVVKSIIIQMPNSLYSETSNEIPQSLPILEENNTIDGNFVDQE